MSQAIEEIMTIEVPERALYLRTIGAEFSRIHSHLLWLGLTADAFGFESLFMHTWKVREKVLDIMEEATGGRVIFSACKIIAMRCTKRRKVTSASLSGVTSFSAERVPGRFLSVSSWLTRSCSSRTCFRSLSFSSPPPGTITASVDTRESYLFSLPSAHLFRKL